MKKTNLIPLVLFCTIFLIYTLYFVKVINQVDRVEQDSIAKSIKRAIESEQEVVATNQNLLKEPETRYVNYNWLNVRRDPATSSPVVEKILRNERVTVLGYPTSHWAYVETLLGKKGYVARRYLSDRVSESDEAPIDTPVSDGVAATPSEVYEVPIITYHHISDDVGKYQNSMVLPAINMISQLDYLVENGFVSITFEDLKAITAGEKALPEKPVILTFNGGYSDAYQASQHLNGKGLKGVFFIVTEKIGQEGYLDWRQVKKMRSWGMEIGSQGLNGVNLAGATDFYLEEEVVKSKEVIEKQLGGTITAFSYPEGAYNKAAMDMVKKAGYSFARTNDSASRFTSKQFYQLPTLRVFFPAGANQFRVWLGE